MIKPFDAILLNKAVHGGGTQVSGSISISANGTYDVSAFANAIVNVQGEDTLATFAEGGTSLYTKASFVTTNAFVSKMSIVSVDLPDASYIGSYAFSDCFSLAQVSAPNVDTIHMGAFSRCSALTTVNFPLVTSLGYGAFNQCANLSEVILPNVTSIAGYAFNNCSQISTLSFPKLSSLVTGCFMSMTGLMSLYLMGSFVTYPNFTMPFTYTPILSSSYTGSFGSIYVPASLYNTYCAADNWSSLTARLVSVA